MALAYAVCMSLWRYSDISQIGYGRRPLQKLLMDGHLPANLLFRFLKFQKSSRPGGTTSSWLNSISNKLHSSAVLTVWNFPPFTADHEGLCFLHLWNWSNLYPEGREKKNKCLFRFLFGKASPVDLLKFIFFVIINLSHYDSVILYQSYYRGLDL